jgi:hypothetical protein
MLCLAAVAWFDRLLRQAGRPDLVQLNASAIPYLLGFSATTMGGWWPWPARRWATTP